MKIESNLPDYNGLTLACLAKAVARIISNYSYDNCVAFVCTVFDCLGREYGRDAEAMVRDLVQAFPIGYNKSDEELGLFSDSFLGGAELEDDDED